MSVRTEKKDSQRELLNLVTEYLDENKSLHIKELEVRFGTRGIKRTSKIDYDNVIEVLLSKGFTCINTGGSYALRVQNEFLHAKSGEIKVSNVRAEITGTSAIQKYCKTNRIVENPEDLTTLSDDVRFVQKRYSSNESGVLSPVNFDDFNFRVALQEENVLPKTGGFVRNIVEKWNQSKKLFRYMNRITLVHPEYPIKIDMSTVKTSKKIRGRMVTEYTVQDANVFNNEEEYEIEIEVDSEKILKNEDEKYKNPAELIRIIKKTISFILIGLQQTNYPISYTEQNNIIQEYLDVVNKKKEEADSDEDSDDKEEIDMESKQKLPPRVFPKNFIGPSSFTLQMENIGETDDDDAVPNIRNNYTVTEKADGFRKLLFVSRGDKKKDEKTKGKIYLIDTNMNIQFTGAITDNVNLFATILDGEHILHNKQGEFINLFAAFDIYFVKGSDVRGFGFARETPAVDKEILRLPMLNNTIRGLNIKSFVKGSTCPLRLEAKEFQIGKGEAIFDACKTILENNSDGHFEYETDGLIFTPASLGVGVDKEGDFPKNFKATWKHSFKWKPAKYNTIDFLVTTQKSEKGEDAVKNMFESGKDMANSTNVNEYKTLVLRVGFDERKHGYINPCQNMIDCKIPNLREVDNEETYKPVPFYPVNPYDPHASICNIMLKTDGNGVKQMFTEENEVFNDNTIVEFSYDLTRDKQWRWVPLRVRYDKTAEFKRGLKNYGNAYHVAESNWRSIHNPITEEIISTGQGIPDQVAEDDVYYNRTERKTQTRGLRDFHNLYVKRKLILSVAHTGDTLIDYAVGKAGDLPKWVAAKLNFVFGIDISKDNIYNRLDGACARYLNLCRKFKKMPGALFINGNSGVNIRNTDAAYSEKGKQIINAVFGEGAKDRNELGEGVYKHFAKGKDGFMISSCQFALHYFFESEGILRNFLQNVSECTKRGGYFISTCYDGNLIFDALRDKEEGESISINKNKQKMWEIQKLYARDEFESDETSIGYPINVYQESINKKFREYLVNQYYLIRMMENYGFVLISNDEAKTIGLPSGTGLFSDLYNFMDTEIKKRKLKKADIGTALEMSDEEKQISFYNRYFVFKKARNVDAESVTQKGQLTDEQTVEITGDETQMDEEIIESMKDQPDPDDTDQQTIDQTQNQEGFVEGVEKVLSKDIETIAAAEGVAPLQSVKQTKDTKDLKDPISETTEKIAFKPKKKKKLSSKLKLKVVSNLKKDDSK